MLLLMMMEGWKKRKERKKNEGKEERQAYMEYGKVEGLCNMYTTDCGKIRGVTAKNKFGLARSPG